MNGRGAYGLIAVSCAALALSFAAYDDAGNGSPKAGPVTKTVACP